MIYIFLDTNIFLHFQDFESIKWNEVVDSSDEFIITLAPIVIDELDKHKYNPVRKISSRAKRLLPKIESIIERDLKCKYNILLVPSRPSDDILATHKLDKKEQDDLLLASILQHVNSLSPGESVLLITNDTGPRLKAKSLDIPTLKLPEKYKLKDEPDEIAKRNEALEKEITELKNNIPVIKLCIEPDLQFLTVPSRQVLMSKEENVEKELEKIKEATPTLFYRAPDKFDSPQFRILGSTLFSLSEDQVSNYNEQLETYYESYKKYFKKHYEKFAFKHNSVEIVFNISNIGSSPASDIDIHLHFPDGFDIVDEEGLPRVTGKPDKPYRPQNRFDIGQFKSSPFVLPYYMQKQDSIAVNPNISFISIKKTNSYDVTWHVNSVKHNQSHKMAKLYLNFADIHNAEGFAIDYKIMAANIPKLITGQLHVSFEK